MFILKEGKAKHPDCFDALETVCWRIFRVCYFYLLLSRHMHNLITNSTLLRLPFQIKLRNNYFKVTKFQGKENQLPLLELLELKSIEDDMLLNKHVFLFIESFLPMSLRYFLRESVDEGMNRLLTVGHYVFAPLLSRAQHMR